LNQKLVLVVVLCLAAAGGAYWHFSRKQIAAEYADALALCAQSERVGSAKIEALDRLYGADAQPSALRLDLSLCALGGSVDRYKEAAGLAGGIGN
jgi:hypothetical protein